MTNEPRSFPPIGARPEWCIDCEKDGEPDGYVVHYSATYTADVYSEDSGPHPAAVRATRFDQTSLARPGHASDLDGLLIDITVHDDVASLRLTSAQARQLADLLITIADAVDPLDAT